MNDMFGFSLYKFYNDPKPGVAARRCKLSNVNVQYEYWLRSCMPFHCGRMNDCGYIDVSGQIHSANANCYTGHAVICVL